MMTKVNDVQAAIQTRHVGDIQAAAQASGAPEVFMRGFTAGCFWSGYERGVAAILGTQAPAKA